MNMPYDVTKPVKSDYDFSASLTLYGMNYVPMVKKIIFCENPFILPQIKLKMMFSGSYPHSLTNGSMLADFVLNALRRVFTPSVFGVEHVHDLGSGRGNSCLGRRRRFRPTKSQIYQQFCNFCYVYVRNVML